ncbi:MAG: hypothetical protein KDE45_00345 [Caldilineaceae bacterium]|nr:hypothetical protein [Caldilineaceae bacterium]
MLESAVLANNRTDDMALDEDFDPYANRMSYPAHKRASAIKWTAADHWCATVETVQIQAGLRVENPHPLTEERKGGDWPLARLMRDYLSVEHPTMAQRDDRSILAAAVGTEILPELLVNVANGTTLVRMPALLAKVLKITHAVELKNYLQSAAAAFEIDAIDAARPNFTEWHTLKPRGTAELLGLGSSPIRLRITEQLSLRDDAVNAVAGIVAATATAAAQNELVACFGLLEDNPTLADGDTLFIASNTASGGAPSALILESAIATLRKQQLNGRNCDADPVNLICAADHEGAARAAVRTIYGDDSPVSVIGTSYLSTDAWYLQADPATWPTVARATMAGAGGNSLRFTPGRATELEGMRDTILESLHTFDYGAVSRIGIVKVPTA